MKTILMLAAALAAFAGQAIAADRPVWPVTCLCRNVKENYLAATIVVTKDNRAVLDELVRKARIDTRQKVTLKAGICPARKLCGTPYTKDKDRALMKLMTGTHTILVTYTWSNPYPGQVKEGLEFGLGGPVAK